MSFSFSIEYNNEAGGDPVDNENAQQNDDNNSEHSQSQQQKQQPQNKKSILLTQYETHHLVMEGITFFTEEFRIVDPSSSKCTTPKSTDQHHTNNKSDSDMSSEQLFYSARTNFPTENDEKYPDPVSDDDDDDEYKEEHEDGDDSDTDDEPAIEIYRSDEVRIGQLKQRLEFRMKIKQTENIPGPKIQLDITVGSLSLFLTPRQLHLLILLSDVLLFEQTKHKSNDKHQQQQQPQQNQEPLIADFERTDINYDNDMNKRYNSMSGGLGLNQGWSSSPLMGGGGMGGLEQFDSLSFDQQYQQPSSSAAAQHHQYQYQSHQQQQNVSYSFDDHHGGGGIGGYAESLYSSNSSMTSSINSSVSQRSHRKRIDLNINADISSFNIRIACLTVILLHEDVLLESSTSNCESPLSPQSVTNLKLLSEKFFNTIGEITVGLGINDMLNTGKILDRSCSSNNLRLVLAPVIMEGEQQRNSIGNQLQFKTSIARADIRECLKDGSTNPILQFNRDSKVHQQIVRPDVILNFNQLQKTIRGSGGRHFGAPRTDINISLSSCQSELDISIIDRLNGVLNPSPFNLDESNLATYPTDSPTTNPNPKNQPKIEINIESNAVDVRLRFPIADLRPIHDPERLPWWERNVRPDYILLNFQQMRFCYTQPNHYDITANEINLHYCVSVFNHQLIFV